MGPLPIYYQQVRAHQTLFFKAHYRFLYLEHLEGGGSVQIIKCLGLKKVLVGGLEKQPEGWVYKILAVLSWKTKTNKQSEHITTKYFITLQFLQNLSRQKFFWDEARLSSLVKKRCTAEAGGALNIEYKGNPSN